MKKIILFIIFIIIFIIIINYREITNNILLSFNICFNSLFPSLIPFMLISNILIKYNFINDLSNLFNFMTTKILKLNKHCSFAIIMSMISGTPSNSKYLKELYYNQLINIKDIQKCINFCHFINPIFILNVIGISFLNNKRLGLIILLSHVLSSFIIALLFRNKKNISLNNNLTNNIKSKKFISILNESIIDTANNLLIILGVITFCLIITGLIDSILTINNNFKFFYGLIEMTQGLNYLSLSNFNVNTKAIISSFIISFGGLCIHLQVYSILDNKKIRYLPYLFSRILHGFFASLLTFVIILLN